LERFTETCPSRTRGAPHLSIFYIRMLPHIITPVPTALFMAKSRTCSGVIFLLIGVGRPMFIEDRGVWAGVEAAEAAWFFLEDLKKGMVERCAWFVVGEEVVCG